MSSMRPSPKAISAPLPDAPFEWNERPAPNGLPTPLTSFIGREREIELVTGLVQRPDVRLLTLTGTGGVGKTRLAIQVASGLTQIFPHGVVFVSLASITDADLVAASVAEALGVPDIPGQSLLARVQAFLAHRDLLLVLDNFEQALLSAPMVVDLLTSSPSLTILCTSRVRLGVSGEHLVTIPPLQLPTPDAAPDVEDPLRVEAVRLFLERANASSADFTCTPDEIEKVTAICCRLDGLPLAIELAAARVKVLSVHDLLGRLELRLNVLTNGPRDAPARQRTMRDSIAWSHDLLTASEQRLYRRLAIFRGGFSLESAESVIVIPGESSGSVFDDVSSLVEHHLLYRKEEPDTTARYFMLETVREDAYTRLVASEEEDALRRQQAMYLIDMSELRQSGMSEHAWLERIEPEHDNIRAVLTWALERGEPDITQRLIGAIWLHFWAIRGHFREGRTWAERARALGPGTSQEMYEEVLFAACEFAASCGELEYAVELAHEAVASAQASENRSRLGMALHHLGKVVSDRDGMDVAEPIVERARTLLDAADGFRARRAAAVATHNLAVATGRRGDGARAEALASEALQRWHDVSSEWGAAATLTTLARLASDRGDHVRASGYGKDALRLSQYLGAGPLMIDALRVAGTMACTDQSQAKLTVRLWSAAGRLTEELGLSITREEQEILSRDLATIRSKLETKVFQAEWAAGRTRPLEQIVEDALTFVPLPPSGDSEGLDGKALHHGLTPREIEVLNHLADRRSDQEIADALFLSRRTINAHVAHILAKLDVRTRRAAVSRARQLSILPTM